MGSSESRPVQRPERQADERGERIAGQELGEFDPDVAMGIGRRGRRRAGHFGRDQPAGECQPERDWSGEEQRGHEASVVRDRQGRERKRLEAARLALAFHVGVNPAANDVFIIVQPLSASRPEREIVADDRANHVLGQAEMELRIAVWPWSRC